MRRSIIASNDQDVCLVLNDYGQHGRAAEELSRGNGARIRTASCRNPRSR
ncbi:MAG TPA: hypothetical protein VKA97_08520 [Pyrinomonadaceae bacterium]|nr:hypothetical protein [Pyrinomonadaceae bacterium]